MKTAKLNDSTRGWFIGDFEGAVYRTNTAEVAVRYDRAGEKTPAHVHEVASEITLVISGTIRINNRVFSDGDIILIEPGETATYESVDDSITVIVKVPSLPGDKFLSEG